MSGRRKSWLVTIFCVALIGHVQAEQQPIALQSIREVPALAINTFRTYELGPGRHLLQFENEVVEVRFDKEMISTHDIPYSIQYLSEQGFQKRLDQLGYFDHIVIKDFQLDPDLKENFLEANFRAAKAAPDQKQILRLFDLENAIKLKGSFYVGRGKPLDTRLKKIAIPATEIVAFQALWFIALTPFALMLRYSPEIVSTLGGRWQQPDHLRSIAASVVAAGLVSTWMGYKFFKNGKKRIDLPLRFRGRPVITVTAATGLVFFVGASSYHLCANVIRSLGF